MPFGLAKLSSPLPKNHSRELIGGGRVGTRQTIKRMKDLVTQGKRDFRLRTEIGKIIAGCPPKDYECYARAVHNYCTHKIKYVFDPNGVELIEAPYRIIESGIADCDSIVVLAAAMLECMGLPARFVTVKADTTRPNEYSHVYLQTKIPQIGWVGLDCTMPDRPFGWEPPPQYPRKTWPSSWDMSEDREGDKMSGLGLDVPHVEYTKGVVVGSEWNFRDESALLTTTPEEMELDPLQNAEPIPVAAPEQDFHLKEELPAVAAKEEAQQPVYTEPVVEVVVQKKPFDWKKAALLGGAVFLLFKVIGGKR